MANPIEFYFDFSSPYGFIASTLIDAVADRHGRAIVWRPFLIGAVYKEYGGVPLEHPLKRDYMLKDFMRAGRFNGLADMRYPGDFPAHSVPPSRVFYWIEGTDPAAAADYARAAYRRFWIDGKGTSDAEAAVAVAEELGHDGAAVREGMQQNAVKDRLRDETAGAIERGVFGSPFMIADGEPFWGSDRIPHLDKWLETGGF